MNTTVQLLHIAKNQQGLHSVMNTKMNAKMNAKYGRGIRTRNTDAEYGRGMRTKTICEDPVFSVFRWLEA